MRAMSLVMICCFFISSSFLLAFKLLFRSCLLLVARWFYSSLPIFRVGSSSGDGSKTATQADRQKRPQIFRQRLRVCVGILTLSISKMRERENPWDRYFKRMVPDIDAGAAKSSLFALGIQSNAVCFYFFSFCLLAADIAATAPFATAVSVYYWLRFIYFNFVLFALS